MNSDWLERRRKISIVDGRHVPRPLHALARAVTNPFRLAAICAAMTWLGTSSFAETSGERDYSLVDVPPFQLPFSTLASPEAGQHFAFEHSPEFAASPIARMRGLPIVEQRAILDEHYLQPRIDKALALYSVSIEPGEIDGVYVETIAPRSGVPDGLNNKVLINLHGGGFTMGARTNGRLESIPLAGMGGFRIVAIDYRQGPEHRFPAASEDVEKVYRELLKDYAPENIGIFGCSAGGILVAQSLAWFQQEGLPAPGAAGIFCAGGGVVSGGDSTYLAPASNGGPVPPPGGRDPSQTLSYFSGVRTDSPLVTPVHHPETLAAFPPTLLINSTRDFTLSAALHTHRQLINAGVEADLHVWEGLQHFFFKDMEIPETAEAFAVMVRFFKDHLGV